jgi:hypothetical protein
MNAEKNDQRISPNRTNDYGHCLCLSAFHCSDTTLKRFFSGFSENDHPLYFRADAKLFGKNSGLDLAKPVSSHAYQTEGEIPFVPPKSDVSGT